MVKKNMHAYTVQGLSDRYRIRSTGTDDVRGVGFVRAMSVDVSGVRYASLRLFTTSARVVQVTSSYPKFVSVSMMLYYVTEKGHGHVLTALITCARVSLELYR